MGNKAHKFVLLLAKKTGENVRQSIYINTFENYIDYALSMSKFLEALKTAGLSAEIETTQDEDFISSTIVY